MSYDVDVWTSAPAPLRSALPGPADWTISEEGAVRPGRSWQILITGPLRVEPEDVPDDVARSLPGISHVYQLSLEPVGAPKSAYSLLHRTARSLASASEGVISDQQTDELKLPSGVRRYRAAPEGESLSLVLMTWFFTETPLLEPGNVRGLVDTLERQLPEALPRRYGEYEPPQYRLEETGLEHFTEFLQAHLRGGVVWYPTRPVAQVNLTADEKWGWHERLGFRANYMTLAVDEAAISQPGWMQQLRLVWLALSQQVRPFFGDVRTLGGYERRGHGTLRTRRETETHPVKAWWWRGIPATLGHAVVLGPPYQALWPTFRDHAEEIDGLWFISKELWTGADVSDVVGGVPEPLQAPTQPGPEMIDGIPAELLGRQRDDIYPQLWPFADRPATT